MRLVYYRKDVPNFGDDLNGLLWPALAPDLFDETCDTGFVGIGTIIGMPVDRGLKKLCVFSSGVGNDRPSGWDGFEVDYRCVRGPVSARLLGLEADRAITDGAVLTPLAPDFPRAAQGGGATLVIPHFQTMGFAGWEEAVAAAGFELVDPRADPKSVIARIASARLVLTESLHGAILADTYGVPWRAFATSKNFGVSKWVDWTLSLGRAFSLTMVPPPDPGPVLAFGRPPAPFGETVQYGAEAALTHFDERVSADPVTLKTRLKELAKRTPLVRPLLGMTPARTAEALAGLEKLDAAPSPAPLVERLRERMLERLDALRTSRTGQRRRLG